MNAGRFIAGGHMPAKINLTSEQINDIIARYNDGESLAYIGNHYNCSNSTIKNKLNEADIFWKPKKLRFSSEIISMYTTRIPTKEICIKFDMTDTHVRRILRDNGIEIESNNYDTRMQYKYNRHFFSKIDTEEKAYWLGYICADGCITEYSVSITSKDKEHMEKFLNSIGSNNKVKQFINMNKMYYTAHASSKQMSVDLRNKGVHINKTFTLGEINGIPAHLFKHFIRGNLDGDGTISNKKRIQLSFLGTYNFLSFIKRHLDLVVKANNRITKHKNIFGLKYSKHSTLIILDYLFTDCSIFLERKYKKYMEIKHGLQRIKREN